MQNPTEQPVPLQADTITTLPGGGVRTIVATVMINGVPTHVQMQVIALAGPNGEIMDIAAQTPASADLDDVVRELRELRRLIATIHGLPVFDSPQYPL